MKAGAEIENPYFGSPEVQDLQQAQDGRVALLRDTPGAVIHARVFSADAPERLGWQQLSDRFQLDGTVTLRGVAEAVVEDARKRLSAFRPTLHRWDLFMAEAQTLRAACAPLVRTSPVPELRTLTAEDVDTGTLHRVQQFLSDQGIVPFSKTALAGQLFPAALVVLQDPKGAVAATGFAAMTHNRFSPYAGIAWVGLIAVAPAYRGKGLGSYVDALSNLAAIEQLGAEGTMEFVAQDNTPSRRMLETCGLRQRPDVTVAMLSRASERMTR